MIASLQGRIREGISARFCDQRVLSEYDLSSLSVRQKLWSANYYSRELGNLDIRGFWLASPTAQTQISDSYSAEPQTPTLDVDGYAHHVHLCVDGFFMNAMSVLDILAHEIWPLYFLPHRPPRLYIGSVTKKLVELHPKSALGKFLTSQLAQTWFQRFQRFRHCTTHESSIVYDKIHLSYDPLTGQVDGSDIVLPDDPRARPLTYRQRKEATTYCSNVSGKIQSLVERAHERILTDIDRSNNLFPISRP